MRLSNDSVPDGVRYNETFSAYLRNDVCLNKSSQIVIIMYTVWIYLWSDVFQIQIQCGL